MSLPQELCEAIIDEVSDDIGTLCSCSLVCRAWRHCSQSHMLGRAIFSLPQTCPPSYANDYLAKRWRQFYKAIGCNADSAIANLVHHLELSTGVDLYRDERNLTWFHDTSLHISETVARLTKLTSLSFSLGYLSWTLHGGLFGLLCSPSLTALELQKASFDSFAELFGIILKCENLTRLSLGVLRIPEINGGVAVALMERKERLIRLTSLIITGEESAIWVYSTLFTFILYQTDVSALSSLTIRCGEVAAPKLIKFAPPLFADFLRRCSTTLKHLGVYFLIDAPLYDTLRLSSLQCCIQNPGHWVVWLRELFSNPASQSLEHISFIMDFGVFPGYPEAPQLQALDATFDLIPSSISITIQTLILLGYSSSTSDSPPVRIGAPQSPKSGNIRVTKADIEREFPSIAYRASYHDSIVLLNGTEKRRLEIERMRAKLAELRTNRIARRAAGGEPRDSAELSALIDSISLDPSSRRLHSD
ncbi:hypothetical protein C8J56DRAFT_944297 [Mycena floridula]|nr:hypothetical protein C8J56DRAFT_944297 [Mycena floridula]